MGVLYYSLIDRFPGMTFDTINAMTIPQLECLLYKGKPPKPGKKTFKSSDDARAWRESQRVIG